VRHTLNPTCPCEDCQRAAFEHRAVTIALGLVVACSFAAWLFLVYR
jgi:hypothetical protein